MAYNLQSLITILQQTLINPQQTHYFVTYNKPHLESLLQKAVYLKQILENSSGPKIESLESQIRDATYQAEDIIESHMVDQVVWWHTHSGLPFSVPDLQQVIKEFDSAIEQVEIVEDKVKMSSGSSSSGAGFLPDHPSSKNALVGADEALRQLKDRLTGLKRKLQIIPIVGMGGIGKTKLSQELYEEKFIVSHFDIRAWTTISQDYSVRAVLLGLLRRPNEKLSDELSESTDNELKTILRKRLYGRTYLVVLDDMWSTHSWDAIKICFPDNNNSSRIILTTRESNVARCVGTKNLQHEVKLMNESESWNLLHQVVFGEDDCPYALEGIGRKIANDCRGLPLAINVIGGFLSTAERSSDIWERIANDVSATISETGDNQFSNVLSLSYNHLPNHLKPCFLYMGVFPEDYEIKGSRLIRMWVAEGFVKANGDKSLEEEAEDYLEALVERNLVLVTRKKSNGKALCYGMHDLLRDLCTRKGGEEKFVHVKNERVEVSLHKMRRVSVHTSSNGMEKELWSLARSFICPSRDMSPEIVSPVFMVLRLLRVLDVLDMQFPEFPTEVLKLVNLRYLAFSCSSKSDIPKEISRLLNLQTLIGEIKGGNVASEIWEMSELRHLKVGAILNIKEGYMKQKMQENLQTISWVTCNHSLIRMGFFKTIPNIKELGIYLRDSILESSEVVDLSYLHKLQTLRCCSKDPWRYLPTLRIPCSLRKLTLFRCVIIPRDLTTLCALPNLEVLKLTTCEFENEELKATEDDVFLSLQTLHLDRMNNLVHWTADDANFPTLRKLVLFDCPVLEEIPSGIGDISTLQSIQLWKCSPSVEASAKQIEEVQSENGNYDLKVDIKEGCMKQKMQENLQTIYWVTCNPSLIRMGFFKTIPNIKNLGIDLDDSILESSEVVDLSYLHKLQTLRCGTEEEDPWRYLPTLRIPCGLRKLSLFWCVIFQRDLTTLCALPNLEVLKLSDCVFENEEFELKATEDDVFRSLQFLHLDTMKNLVRWTADDDNFPTLRKLILFDCPVLEEIPSGIGDISTLQYIGVLKCSPSVEASAIQIEEVQQSENDNYDLEVYIEDE